MGYRLLIIFLFFIFPTFAGNFEQDYNSVKVYSDNNQHTGMVKKTDISIWKTVYSKGVECFIDLPNLSTKHLEKFFDQKNDVSILLYPLDFGYLEVRYIFQLVIEKKSIKELEQNIKIGKELIAMNQNWPEIEKQFEIWDTSKHVNLDKFDKRAIIFYRKDIDYSDNKILSIRGSIVKVNESLTDKPLHEELEPVMEKIINSIKPTQLSREEVLDRNLVVN